MDAKELKDNLEGLNRAWQEFKTANDARLKAVEEGKGTAELEEKVKRIDADIQKAVKAQEDSIAEKKALEDRINRLEADKDAGTGGGSGGAQERKHVDLFTKWMRAGQDKYQQEQCLKELLAFESKAYSGAAAATGGAAIPTVLSSMITEQQIKLSPVRNLVKVVTAGTRDYNELVLLRQETSTWVAEDGSRSATGNVAFRKRTPTFGTVYAYVTASHEVLQDAIVDLGALTARVSASQFAQAEGIAVISGNGTAKPTGLLNTTPVTTDDDASPLRAAAALEYVPLDPGSSPSDGIQPDPLITLVHTLKSQYRASASWTMNSLTTAAVRQMKDTYGQYLWQPSLAAGNPSTLLGYPVVTWENVPNVGQLANCVMFGDFKAGYLLVELAGQRMIMDEVTAPGFVKWYIYRRVGGCILDNDAIKVGRCAAA